VSERCLRQVEHRKNIGTEGALELLRRDLFQTLLHVLLGGIVHQDIEAPELAHNALDNVLAEGLVAYVAADERAVAIMFLNRSPCVLRILLLVEIDDDNVGALPRYSA